MSLDGFRDAISREKRNEIANTELSRKRKLRELYAYTSLLNAAHPAQLHNWVVDADPSDDELRFLDENDITKGRHFQDSTLPSPFPHAKSSPIIQLVSATKSGISLLPSLSSPPLAVDAVPGLEEQLKAASASPSISKQPLPTKETLPVVDGPVSAQNVSDSPPETASQSEIRASPTAHDGAEVNVPEDEPQAKRRKLPGSTDAQEKEHVSAVEPDGPVVDPKEALPLTSEDSANLPESELAAEESEHTPRPPQVVHLPPKEVQEARLRETERNLEKVAEKERKDDERLNLPTAVGELASSPSSTVGPYSTATPHPPHHSPDTSPDEENFRGDVSGDPQLQDPVAQAAKEEHDEALQAQMKSAREIARAASPETPGAQLQLEDEQAIRQARDAHGASTGRMSEVVPSGISHSLTEHAEDVASDAQAITDQSQPTSSEPLAAESLPTPSTTAPEPTSSSSTHPDTIAVKPREQQIAPPDHPTPPADVEIKDAPTTVDQDEQSEPAPHRSERMTTRVASGAMRQKSLSEILGEGPSGTLTPRSGHVSASRSPGRPRTREGKSKEKVSTVIFAKQNEERPSKALKLFSEDYAALQGASQDSNRDYLQGLFQYQAHHPPRSTPLQDLLASARKTVTTTATLATLRECQDYKILKRVYQLQNANRWSLRQLKKSAEPPRQFTQLDHLLGEMKWMSTDFREERKWKESLAAQFAHWCAEFVNSSPAQQATLQIKPCRRKGKREVGDEDHEMDEAPTPDLSSPGANETESEPFDDDDLLPNINGTAPAGLFSLGFDDVVMKIDRTPASDALLQELPAYEPTVESLNDLTFSSFSEPPILPVSKYVTGKLVSKTTAPPRKRSRYEYESEDEPVTPPSRSGLTSTEHSMPSTPGRRFNRNDLPPEMTEVALFNQENKHVRDRLQAAHHFRPPSEFLMPAVSFFESRNSSQWLWDEDQKLRTLVKEYTFNWSLIAQELSQPSLFTSSAERRTPWECFERWVQLEGLPAEMSKTQYFRTYQSRLEQAQRTITNQHQAMQQQLQQNMVAGQIPSQLRRRTTQPIRVERRRNNRYLAVIDGMRKLARKRESVAHKQAEAQKAAALRKAHEPVPPKSNVHSPQEFSRLKWEREEKIREKSEQYRLNMQRQAAAAAAAQRQQGAVPGQPAATANGVAQPQRNGTPSNSTNVPTSVPNSTTQSGHPSSNVAMQARTHPGQPTMQGNFPNGNMPGMGMGVPSIPQAQMQANMQNQQRMPPPENVRLAMQRGQYPSTNQHQFQLQQQQINMASSLANQMGAGNGIPNANMIASMAGQNMNGNSNHAMNGMSGNAGSPRMTQMNPSMQGSMRGGSGGVAPSTAIQQFQNQVRNAHPDWPQEQINKAATAEMNKWVARNRAMATSAAAGTSMGANQIGSNVYLQNGGMGGGSPSPNSQVHHYQQQLQQRMMTQQRSQSQVAGSPRMGNNQARPPSRSATPQNPQQMQQSPGMQHAQLARN